MRHLSTDTATVNVKGEMPKTRTLSKVIDIEIPDFLAQPGCQHNMDFDAMRDEVGPDGLARRFDDLIRLAQAACDEYQVTFLATDVDRDGGKIILTASQSSRDLENAPYMAFFPIMVLFLTVLALNFAGDRLRSYFDVRELSL